MPVSDQLLANLNQQLVQSKTQQLSQEALQRAGRLGLTALGVGAGARGLWGLVENMSRNVRKPGTPLTAPLKVEIPVEDAEEKYAADGSLLGDVKHILGSNVQRLGESVSDTVRSGVNSAVSGTKDVVQKHMKGQDATTPEGIPWSIPLLTAAGAGGVGAGWSLTDWLVNARRRQSMNAELEQARKEYDEALFGKVGEALDALYDDVCEHEKRAAEKKAEDGPWTVGNVAGAATGVGLTYAGLSSLLAGLGTYDMAKKRQRRTLLERAQKERRRARYDAAPLPIYAVPTPVTRDHEEVSPEELVRPAGRSLLG